MQIDRLIAALGVPAADRKLQISQNGVKYRSLCGNCNNNILGTKFDPHLNKFTNKIAQLLTSTLSIPASIEVEGRPNAIVRSLIGHLAAAESGQDHGFIGYKASRLLLDDDQEIDTDISVFYWIYPYRQTIILPDALMPYIRGRHDLLQRFAIIKYFPVAFLITDADAYEGLSSLTWWRHEPNSFETRLPIDLLDIHDPFWPEQSDRGNFLFGGEQLSSAVLALSRTKMG